VTDPERDEDLILRYLQGEAQAFAVLVTRHESRVFNVALRVLGDPDDARDATQDTFLTVVRKLSQFRGDAAFTTWLHRVTVNACYDILRKRRRQPMLRLVPEGDEPTPDFGPPVEDHADATIGSIDVARALQQIPEEYRVVLVLADVQDLPYEEISRVLDVPIGTVKSRVHRGRIALGRALGLSEGPSREPAPAPPPSEKEP
jgi:RNA polymerase sigma-70 factor (ECF subfamily)